MPMIDTLYDRLPVLMLVFLRFTGMLAFNPVLTRRGFPAQARVAIIGGLTLLVAPAFSAAAVAQWNGAEMMRAMIRELAVGFACGTVFQLFYYMLIFAGDQMDMAFGLSMAKAFDPGSNIQMSVSSSFLNLFFIMYLFATNSHLILIRLFTTSFVIIPLGQGILTQNVAQCVIELFGYAFQLGFQLAIPFIAMELILEFAVGVLMKFIPQINVFVINIQLKVILGLFLLFAFVPVVSGFLTNYLDIMLRRTQDLLYLFVQ